jgi:hypothetical protein
VALEQVDERVRTVVERSSAVSSATQDAISQQTDTLRQMIINNATIVRNEIDEISTTLTNSFSAESDYGVFKSTTQTALTANGAAITQEISDRQELSSTVQGLGSTLSNYISKTNGYIRYGVVIPAQGGNPAVIGIAIGQSLRSSSTTTIDGNVYDVIDQTEFRSILSATRLSFYQGAAEVAYISNEKLFIKDAQITSKILFGAENTEKWEINHNNGFSIKWIGG